MFTFVEFRHAWRTHPLAVGCAALLAGCKVESSPERYADMVLAARTAGDDPVLQPRREPARNALTGMIDHVLRWVGLR
jgi:hypothetical protein